MNTDAHDHDEIINIANRLTTLEAWRDVESTIGNLVFQQEEPNSQIFKTIRKTTRDDACIACEIFKVHLKRLMEKVEDEK